MVGERFLQAGGVAAFQGGEDRGVPGGRLVERAMVPGRPEAEPVGVEDASGEDWFQGEQSRQAEDGKVKLGVGFDERPGVVAGGILVHFVEKAMKAGDVSGAEAGDCGSAAAELDASSQIEHLRGGFTIQRGDDGSLVTVTADQSFAFEAEEGFPDGALAAGELGGDGELGEDRSGHEFVHHDLAAKIAESVAGAWRAGVGRQRVFSMYYR